MKSPISYLGGKSRLAKQIVEMLPEHTTYVEPFCGAAWVFFEKEPSKVEVINDMNLDLVTFWRVVQNHLEEFLRHFKHCVISREIFDILNRTDPSTLAESILEVHWRMKRVVIERMDALDCILRHDTPKTFFYIDPPYYGFEKDYAVVWPREKFTEMAALLTGIKGTFILSLNDVPEVRDIFAGFRIKAVKTLYSAAATGGGKEAAEVLIYNF